MDTAAAERALRENALTVKGKGGKWVGQVTVGYHPDTGKTIRKYQKLVRKL